MLMTNLWSIGMQPKQLFHAPNGKTVTVNSKTGLTDITELVVDST